MTISFNHQAKESFAHASEATRGDARPVLELLSSGFQITWFREVSQHIWLAAAKPSDSICEQFGLRHECFVIGNGYATDFHQRTLRQEPPEELVDRVDQSFRFVASDAPVAEAYCAAWAQQRRATVVVIKRAAEHGADGVAHLYALLSSSLWRRDFFAESEPVRLPSEFFGRELYVNQLFSKILLGAPVAVFGLRKVGKSSLLGRVEDLIRQDESAISATAFLIGNATKYKSGRWWHLAQAMLGAWQASLQAVAVRVGSKVHAKAERLNDAIGKKVVDTNQLVTAFERDLLALLKAARAMKAETGREVVRLVFFLDECDHLYPHLEDSGFWREDFFVLWNMLQAIKRSMESPEELVYVLGGVNPSGVEQGVLQDNPNPLYETQTIYLEPMSKPDADSLVRGLGMRMGLLFDDKALTAIYDLVGGHPLLLRRFGTAIHEMSRDRTVQKTISEGDVRRTFDRKKRDLYNQVMWILEHLARVAPDEERLLRDIARGGHQAYADLWGDNDFRETYAYHLERYGLIRFTHDLPEVTLNIIREALQRPVASEFGEQKKRLKELVEALEHSIRTRIRVDLEESCTPEEAALLIVNAIPSDAKNRPLARQDLLDLGEVAGLGGILDALNWGDYEIILDKRYAETEWVGREMDKSGRLALLKEAFRDAHLVRHNNDHGLKQLIDSVGFLPLCQRFSEVLEMFSA